MTTTLIPPPDAGVYLDMAAQTYHSIDVPGRSDLVKLAQNFTPAHVRHNMETESLDKDGMALGSALHKALLEPEEYERTVRLGPINESTHTTYGRGTKRFQEAMEAEPEVTFLTSEQEAKQQPMIASLRAHPMIAAAAARVEHRELTCIANVDLRELATHVGEPWLDAYGDDDQLLVKVRLDMVGSGIITDLKTMAPKNKGSVDALQWSAVDYGYYHQAGLYPYVARLAGMNTQYFTVAAVESVSPYVSFFCRVNDPSQAGLRHLLPAMVTMARCYRLDEWPGYGDGVIELDPPDSWLRQVEAQLTPIL